MRVGKNRFEVRYGGEIIIGGMTHLRAGLKIGN
jgi:hypothetical protein